jgi:hypothetical protein
VAEFKTEEQEENRRPTVRGLKLTPIEITISEKSKNLVLGRDFE